MSLFIESSTAPPFVVFRSSAKGVSLRARSASAARARIDALLACGEDITIADARLDVIEPASQSLVEAFHDPIDTNDGSRPGWFPRDDVAEIVAREGHQCDSVATEAWERFGAPRQAGFRQAEPGCVVWTWERHDSIPVEMFEAWHDYLVKHQALQHNTYLMRVQLYGHWLFRFRSKSAGVAGDPFPTSSLSAYLAGRRQYARMSIVLPYAEANAAFRADHKRLNKALQVELPRKDFKLSKPPKKLDGWRSFGKLK